MRYSSLSKLPRGTNELVNRLFYLFLFLCIFRIGVQTPLPGVDLAMVADLFKQNRSNLIVGYFDIFTGGALSNMSLLALSIYPYISSSIMIQLLSHTHPSLDQLRKEGERGRQVLNQYTRYLTYAMSLLQSFGIAKVVIGMNMTVVNDAYFYLIAVVSLSTGTMFMMWLGDQITRYGLGNGISVIMFSGIVARLPETLISFIAQTRIGQVSSLLALSVVALIASTILLVVYMERAQRRIPITYPRRQQMRSSQSQSDSLPLKLNMTGVLPPIVAQMLLVFPIGAIDYLARRYQDNTFLQYTGKLLLAVQPGSLFYIALFSCLVVVFAFYLTTVFFNTKEIAENLKRSGAMITGVRPGIRTSDYIDTILSRTTFLGAIYLSLIACIPDLIIRYLRVPTLFGGTSLLISVVVVMEFATQVQTYLIPSANDSRTNKTKLLD